MNNENLKKIKVMRDGVEKEAEIIAVFKLEENGKDYILYTFNERQDENIKILASVFTKEEEGYVFENIKTDEEWEKVKEVIKELAKKGDN